MTLAPGGENGSPIIWLPLDELVVMDAYLGMPLRADIQSPSMVSTHLTAPLPRPDEEAK
jgi:hypothetical protein